MNNIHQNLSFSSSFWSIFLHVILFYSITLLQPTTNTLVSALGSNETDKLALLKFKESVDDPNGVLNSWNDSVHFCNWHGISCGKRHQRITGLNLEGSNLRGTISPYVGNLSFLRVFNLGNNSFSDEIPAQVVRLFRLQSLNLSYNMLEGNIPFNLSYCSDLRKLGLGNNNLTGTIPIELGSLTKLEILNLQSNSLTGGIPASLGNISSLNVLAMGTNNLVGIVPHDLGRFKGLIYFAISVNNLFGTIPLSLYNISSIEYFFISNNKFTGTLPSNIGKKLYNLRGFGIGGNQFSGIIPDSLSNASRLQVVDILNNKFVGQVPSSLGKLRDLQWLNLGNNSLGSYSTSSLDFITSLTNCSHLTMLSFSYNSFGGVLPNSIANLSTQLTMLFLGFNEISGNIPATLENLVNLIILSMPNNLLNGVIPPSLGKLTKLQVLALGSNTLAGNIPSSIGNLTQIYELTLGHNKLQGSIPANIAGHQYLQHLDFSYNGLSGAIPKEVFSFSSFVLLDLSKNSFTGSLPVEVGNLKSVSLLNLSKNNLTGEIPKTIEGCESLESLSLSGNSFQGTLPSTLASLRGLQYMDLSRNNFTGPIPQDLEKLTALLSLDLSFNDLDGEVPKTGVFQNISAISIAGNAKLCGGLPELQLPACPIKESKWRKINGRKVTIAMVCIALILLVFSVLAIYYRRRIRKLSPTLSTIDFLSKVSYRSLYEATSGFSPSMLIGTGSFGSVYKGILGQEENPVAIKVLNLQQKGASKSFIAECNALRNIRHRNLVKILTCCSSMDYNGNEFKALIFQYMSNGSLERWLNPVTSNDETRSTSLSLTQRLNIVIDVASAVCYLHHHCDQPIIHCDLKPSNVLLDEEMIAHVSDFGIARLISDDIGSSEGQTSTIGIKGTIGYAPPEYAMGGEPSREGDVYSYGILVLELFTGRRPTDEMFKDNFNLHNFVKMALPEKVVQVVDPNLLPREVEETTRRRGEGETNRNKKCLVSILDIGLACSEDSPNERMDMEDVILKLQRIRNAFTGERNI